MKIGQNEIRNQKLTYAVIHISQNTQLRLLFKKKNKVNLISANVVHCV